MIRTSTIFVIICMIVIAGAVGFTLHSSAGFGVLQSAIGALGVFALMLLYHAVTMRLSERTDVTGQITDLSRGTTDLARQVGEFGRRLAAVETRMAAIGNGGQDRIRAMTGEIGELGALVKELAAAVATHDDILTSLPEAIPADPAADLAAPPQVPVIAREVDPREPSPAPESSPIVTTLTNAIEAGTFEIYLQPMVTLPQRKVRFYEAVTRLRDESGRLIPADQFIGAAETAGVIGRIDHLVLSRCVQVLRRLAVRNKDVGLFCNISAATLADPAAFRPCLDFLDANRTLAASFVLEFKQATLRGLGPVEKDHLAALVQRGFHFSMDHVTDLKLDIKDLADRGVRFVKVPAVLLLDQKLAATSDIHPSDLSDLLGRQGISLIAERIEGERAVVDLLDYDVRFGQGFLFSAPRPLRPEAAATDAAPSPLAADKPAPAPVGKAPRTEAPRTTGNAALIRRAGSGLT